MFARRFLPAEKRLDLTADKAVRIVDTVMVVEMIALLAFIRKIFKSHFSSSVSRSSV